MQSLLSRSDPVKDSWSVTIFLANLASGNLPLVHTLLALALDPSLRNVRPPDFETLDLFQGFSPNKVELTKILESCKVSFQDSPEIRLVRLPDELDYDYEDRCEAAYTTSTKFQVSRYLNALLEQWPSAAITRPITPEFATYLPAVEGWMGHIRALFEGWHRNSEFKNYIERIQSGLDSMNHAIEKPAYYSIPRQIDVTYTNSCGYLKIGDLLRNPPPDISCDQDAPISTSVLASLIAVGEPAVVDSGAFEAELLLERLADTAEGDYQLQYVKELRNSHDALVVKSLASPKSRLTSEFPRTMLKEHLEHCRGIVNSLYNKIYSKLVVPSAPICQSAERASMLPRLSPSILLHLLAAMNPITLSTEWKASLLHYACSMADMQRAERLVASLENESDLLIELQNPGHENWDPSEYPDWLLLELENKILIRPEQAQIAREMIAPQTGNNSIIQLNMGLGKSSLIVPIVAATLADKSKLVRVVVLKSLSEQMMQLIVSKLGGLIGRRIYRMPVSRSLSPTLATAELIQRTYKECMRSGGILLVEPESLLSFELLGIDYFLSQELTPSELEIQLATTRSKKSLQTSEEKVEIGKLLIQTQQWLYQHARDILDESDELLNVKVELIYTLGMQQNIQFSPDRWSIIQNVLCVVSSTARDVSNQFPQGLELREGLAGAFPRIRILQEAAGSSLLRKVAKHICSSGMPSLAMWTFTREEQEVIFEYITDPHIAKARVEILEKNVLQIEFTKMTLLLLRGLFATGVLGFVFAKKRWRVNYGLDLTRSMLAVPYHAKDSPSARSEFSHPDTAITLTCLSYYYGGLTNQQIQTSFEMLFVSDHAQEDYVQWIQHCESLPKCFKYLTGVNLRDKQQCANELFPAIRYSKNLIDYYLQRVVFPKEMKDFTNKLSSSGWEIARTKAHPTTGFSGTNDSKHILPLAIQQSELEEQLFTNAENLDCILCPDNSYDTKHIPALDVLNAATLLDAAVEMEPQIRVILDVGAQLLEDNEKVAAAWLDRIAAEDAQAVIFFQDDALYVLDRDGGKEPLLISPLARQMDQCLVYLDESHCRGVDLKLPSEYRAIVTLGPDLTKDRLAQACKRLRKLGHGQSVVFCAPSEVQSKILDCSGKNDASLINVLDVLYWAIHNEWYATKKSIPLWATQGIRHYRRRAACDLESEVPWIPTGILEPEALTLEERYGLHRQLSNEGIIFGDQNELNNGLNIAEFGSIRARCREFGFTTIGDADLQEEQERELHPENEREQHVESPPPARPLQHTVHGNIRKLVLTGSLAPEEEGIAYAFDIFDITRAREWLKVDDWDRKLLISLDFAHTVQIQNDGHNDLFLRPVHFIISFRGQNGEPMYLVLSPFEVQELLPHMRGQDRVRLHTYTPRLSLSNRSLEDLSFCAIPPVPAEWSVPEIATTINLFAGQLYLRNAAEYRKLCRFLGVLFQEPYAGVEVRADGFISPETRELQDDETAAICKFERSPIDFLRMVTTFRRWGQKFAHSHIGKIFNGELVKATDFEVFERIEEHDPDSMDVDEDTTQVKQEPNPE